MIDLYFWPTPNGHKITLMLEETGLDYTIHPVNISQGEQMAPAFIALSPNNKMPAIVDHDPGDAGQPGGGGPLSIFESGAILLYLAKKAKAFAGETLRERVGVKEWLFWQVGGLGPMAGQMAHFTRFAPEPVPYAIRRYTDETVRLLGVLDRRLADHPFLAGGFYSVADMATYPWVRAVAAAGMIDGTPHVARWVETIGVRPATVTAYAKGTAVNPPAPAA
jgi:GST-like protein